MENLNIGITIMVIGMSTVFVFLVIMIVAMNITTKVIQVINKYFFSANPCRWVKIMRNCVAKRDERVFSFRPALKEERRLLALDVGLAVGGGHVGLADKQNQYDDCHHIGYHGNQLHINGGRAAQHNLQAGAESEQQTAEQCALWLEFAEYDRRNGDKALADNGDGPELSGDGHRHAGAAEARQEARKADTEETHADDVDAQRLTGLRMLAAGP